MRKEHENCGCESKILEGHELSSYLCPMHRAAPRLYRVLKMLSTGIGVGPELIGTRRFVEISQALIEAENK